MTFLLLNGCVVFLVRYLVNLKIWKSQSVNKYFYLLCAS